MKKILIDSEDNWIIIGDNSSGKSDLLQLIVRDLKNRVYYIDSVNRYFNIRNINLSIDNVPKVIAEEIVHTRIDLRNYNLMDSFGTNEHIEQLYPVFHEEMKRLLKEFLGIEFTVEREQLEKGFGKGEIQARINGDIIKLSSGYQAIIRLFSELTLFNEKEVIVIDEIDEFLSPKQSSRIFNFLMDVFPENRFIISTHSSDLIASSDKCKIIGISESEFSVTDSEDITSLTEANTLFNTILHVEECVQESYLDNQLQRLLELKIIGSWTDDDEAELKNISIDELSSVQLLIYRQIEEW